MSNSREIAIKSWESLRMGNMEPLGILYDLFVDDLYAYGTQFTSDKSIIMDAIHDLFLDVYKYRKNLAATDNVKFYLLKSLKNKLVKKKQSKVIAIGNHILSEEKNSILSHEEEIVKKEHILSRSQKVTNAISKLSDIQKKVLFLRYTQEKSYKDVADIMGVSVESTRTSIYRAIKSLRSKLTLILLITSLTF